MEKGDFEIDCGVDDDDDDDDDDEEAVAASLLLRECFVFL